MAMAADTNGSVAIPPDLVEVGGVRGAYGVKGWVKVAPWAEGESLLATRRWWLMRPAGPQRLEIQQSRRHGRAIVAKWDGCDSKEAADSLKGLTLGVARGDFPQTADGEVYWTDLIGSRVVNRADEELGQVAGLGDNGAGQWLEVESASREIHRIPIASQYVDEVDLERRLIRVDWNKDW